jgi:hypothetical protein
MLASLVTMVTKGVSTKNLRMSWHVYAAVLQQQQFSGEVPSLESSDHYGKTGLHSFYGHTVFDVAISRLTSVHSKLVQSRQYTLLKTTSQRHCISNVRHDPGYGLDVMTTQRGFASIIQCSFKSVVKTMMGKLVHRF